MLHGIFLTSSIYNRVSASRASRVDNTNYSDSRNVSPHVTPSLPSQFYEVRNDSNSSFALSKKMLSNYNYSQPKASTQSKLPHQRSSKPFYNKKQHSDLHHPSRKATSFPAHRQDHRVSNQSLTHTGKGAYQTRQFKSIQSPHPMGTAKKDGQTINKHSLQETERSGHHLRHTRGGHVKPLTRRQMKRLEFREKHTQHIKPTAKKFDKSYFGEEGSLRIKRQVTNTHQLSTHIWTDMGQMPVSLKGITQTRTLTNTICNNGSAAAGLSINLQSTESQIKEWQADPLSVSLGTSSCTEFPVTLAPTVSGKKTARLMITDIKAGDNLQVFSISGTATQADSKPPKIQPTGKLSVSEPHDYMTIDSQDNLVLANSGESRLYKIADSSAEINTGQLQEQTLSPPLARNAKLCPGPEDSLIESGMKPRVSIPNLNLRHNGAIVRQIIYLPPFNSQLHIVPSRCSPPDPKAITISGKLKIKLNDQLASICRGSINPKAAQVACWELGYPKKDARFLPGCREEESTTPIFSKRINCQGNEQSLSDCRMDELADSCDDNMETLLTCHPPQSKALHLVRLKSSDCIDKHPDITSGRLEIRMRKEPWGTVCKQGFDYRDATTACRQYHNQDFIAYGSPVAFSSNVECNIDLDKSLPIIVSNMACSGSELSPRDCMWEKPAGTDCNHYEDIHIQCEKALHAPSGCSNPSTETIQLLPQGIFYHNWQTGLTEKIQGRRDLGLGDGALQWYSPDINTVLLSNGSSVQLLRRHTPKDIFSRDSSPLPLNLTVMAGRPGSSTIYGLGNDIKPELVRVSVDGTGTGKSYEKLGPINISDPKFLAISSDGRIFISNGKQISLFDINETPDDHNSRQNDKSVGTIISVGVVAGSSSRSRSDIWYWSFS